MHPLSTIVHMRTSYDEGKLCELIIHIAERLHGERFSGSTKLNKILFFVDFTHVRTHGQPITGAEYQKLEFGPAPRRLLPVRQHLVAAGDIEVIDESFLGRRQTRLVALRSADLSQFSDDEMRTVEIVLNDLAGLTASQVSALSHEEPAWRHTEYNEAIPYELALVPVQQVVTPTAQRLAAALAHRYLVATCAR